MNNGRKVRATRISTRFFPVMVALSALFAVVAVNAPAYGDTIKISGTGGALPALKLVAATYMKKDPGQKIVFMPNVGSSGGIKAVLAGGLDIGVSARTLKPEEARQGAVLQEYATTPLIFATALKNKGSGPGYTLRQYAAIFAGTLTAWPDGSVIRLVLRPETDSDTILLREMSPEMDSAIGTAFSRKERPIAMTDEDCVAMIGKIPGSIGTIPLSIAGEGAVKALSVNGVVPSVDTMKNGTYPYIKRFGLVTKQNPPGHVTRFIDFIKNSVEARKILRKAGHWVPENKTGN
jgi:phosphate transport system substrate-binding protein